MQTDLLAKFPGVRDGWARFDGPAGTQMVDEAIDATAAWSRSGNNANSHGEFPQAHACDDLIESARATVGEFLNADPQGLMFGANMTTMTMAFTRAIAHTLSPGQRLVGTFLDHDANVNPWRLAAQDAHGEHVQASFDGWTGRLDPQRVIELITPNTAWVAVTGASNLVGSLTDLPPIIEAAHARGARVFVDAVALAPHRRIDITALGCDALATSPYKWYGPHAGVLWVKPELRDSLVRYRVRPAEASGPSSMETGTASYEGISAVKAAARFLINQGMDNVERYEMDVFAALLGGLQGIDGVRVVGPPTMDARVPTASFVVDGVHADDVARHLAHDKIAVWSGSSYAVGITEKLGLDPQGGVIRAGVVRYITADDVERLLLSVRELAKTR